MHDADMKPVPVDVFKAVRQAGEGKGDEGGPGLARSFDQFNVSINGFDDRAFLFKKIVHLTDHGVTPRWFESKKFLIVS
jgi:hypothetical protein